MSSSHRRTYDTDAIILRQVFARDSNNNFISTGAVMISDGRGGTYWAVPSSLATVPAYRTIATDAGIFTASNSESITIRSGSNIGMEPLFNTTSTGLSLYAKAFSRINLPQLPLNGINATNSINAFSNGQLHPDINIYGVNGISIRSDPQTNSLTFDAGQIRYVSTGPYAFTQIDAFSNITIGQTWSTQQQTKTSLQTDSPSTIFRFIGVDEVVLSTVVTEQAMYIRMKNFTTSNYNQFITDLSNLSATVNYANNPQEYFSSLSTGVSGRIAQVDFIVSTNYSTLSSYISQTSNLIGPGLSSVAQFTSNTSNTLFATVSSGFSTLSTTIGTACNLIGPGVSSVGLFTSNTSNTLFATVSSGFSTLSTTIGTASNLIGPGLSSVAQFTSNTSNSLFATVSSGFSTLSTTIGTASNLIGPGVSSVSLFTSNTSNTLYGVISSGFSTLSTAIGNIGSNFRGNTLIINTISVNTISSGTIATLSTNIGLAIAGITPPGGVVSIENISAISTGLGLTSNMSQSGLSSLSTIIWQNYSTLSSYVNQAQGSVSRDDLSSIAEFTSNTSNSLLATVSSGFSTLSTTIGFTSNLIGPGVSSIAEFTSNTSNSLLATVSSGFSTLSTTIGFTSNLIGPGVSSIGLFTSNTSNSLFATVSSGFSTLSTTIGFTSNLIGPGVSSIAEFTSNTSNSLLATVSSGFSTLSTTIGFTSNLIGPGVSSIGLFTSNTSNSLFATVSSGFSTLSTTIGFTSNLIGPGVSSVGLFTSNTSNTLYAVVSSGFSTLSTTIGSNFSSLTSTITNNFSTLSTNIGRTMVGLSTLSTSTGSNLSSLNNGIRLLASNINSYNASFSTTSLTTTYTYYYTGAAQTYTVGTGVTLIRVVLIGAGGGGGGGLGPTSGGGGAYVEGYLKVLPGISYTIVVGEGGICSDSSSPVTFGGGGSATPVGSFNGGGSGGGRSAIVIGPVNSQGLGGTDIVTAGGGGGGGHTLGGFIAGGSYGDGTQSDYSNQFISTFYGKGGSSLSPGLGGQSTITTGGGLGANGIYQKGGNGGTRSGGGGGGYFGGGGGGSWNGAQYFGFPGGGGGSYTGGLLYGSAITGNSIFNTLPTLITSSYLSSPGFYFGQPAGGGGAKAVSGLVVITEFSPEFYIYNKFSIFDPININFADVFVFANNVSTLTIGYSTTQKLLTSYYNGTSNTTILTGKIGINNNLPQFDLDVGGSVQASSITVKNTISVGPSTNIWLATGVVGTGGNAVSTIAKSSDGYNWTPAVTGTSPFFQGSTHAIAYNGKSWVAGGYNGQAGTYQFSSIARSFDTSNWTAATQSPFTNGINTVAWGNNKWAAGGQGQTPQSSIATSLDGLSWTVASQNPIQSTLQVSWNGSYWLAGGRSATAISTIGYSTDGSTWTSISTGTMDKYCSALAWNGSYWVAGGLGGTVGTTNQFSSLARSYDGLNWTSATQSPFYQGGVDSVAWNGNLWVAAGVGQTTAGVAAAQSSLAYSSDGLNWFSAQQSPFFQGSSISVAWNGSYWVAVGRSADTSGLSSIAISTDGSNWIGAFNSPLFTYGTGVIWSGYNENSTLTKLYGNTIVDTLTINGNITSAYNTFAVNTNTRNVGVGTSSPSYLLDVAGTLRAQTLIGNFVFNVQVV